MLRYVGDLAQMDFFCFSFFLYQFVGSLDITVEALERKQKKKRKKKHCILYSNWCSIDFTCFYCLDCDGVRWGRGVDKKWFHVGRLIWPVMWISLLAQARLETLIYVLNDYFIRFGNIYALFMPCKLHIREWKTKQMAMIFPREHLLSACVWEMSENGRFRRWENWNFAFISMAAIFQRL